MTNYAMETHGRGSADGPETDESHIASGRPSSGGNYWEAGDISLTAGESRNHRKTEVVFLTSGNTERDGVILLTTGGEQVGKRKWRHISDAHASFRQIMESRFFFIIHSLLNEFRCVTTGPECLSMKMNSFATSFAVMLLMLSYRLRTSQKCL